MENKTVEIKCTGASSLSITELSEFQGNLKSLSVENFKRLKELILSLGFSSPIHIWKNEDENFILDGHQRLKVLMGMQDEGFDIPLIPIVYVEADSFEQAKRKVLAFTSQFGKINKKGFKEFLESSGLMMEELKGSLSFPEMNVDKFLDKYFEKPEDGKDVIPAPPRKCKSKTGDIFKLGLHRVLCGDAANDADVERLMDGELCDMIFTDPPYNVNYEGKTSEKLKIENDVMDDNEFRHFLHASYSNYFNVSREGAVMYVCHADSEGYNFRIAMMDAGWEIGQCIIWKKDSLVLGRQDYHWKHEPILYGWKPGGERVWNQEGQDSTIWEFSRPKRSSEHPTMKPIELVCNAIKNSSNKFNLILDFFGGSGSTLIASHKLGRRCNSIEMDPRFVDVILNRYHKYTDEEPIRMNEDGSMTPWSEIQEQ